MSQHLATLSAIFAATLATASSGCQAVDSGSAAEPTQEQRTVGDLAVDALAAYLEIPRDRIAVTSITAVEWRDSSLGCPRPGRAYLDVITPGHRVTLQADGQTYVVHAAGNRAFVCSQSRLSTGPADAGQELGFGPQLLAARKDLAERLHVPENEIRLSGAEPTTWPDASLGCPEPGMQYAQAQTDGWALTLRHGDRDYTYHADARRAIPCPGISAD